MLYHIITRICGEGSCALTGTVCDRIGKETIPSHQTAPDPSVLYGRLSDAASGGDVILLAGKGHEDYEINRLGSRPFSEASIIKVFNNGGLGYEYNDSCGSGEDV